MRKKQNKVIGTAIFIILRFLTKFSLPTPGKPIPVAIVKVYFFIADLTDPSEKRMQFRFENDSLIHSIDRTIRLN